MPRTTNLDTSKPGVWVDQIRYPYTCTFLPNKASLERQLAPFDHCGLCCECARSVIDGRLGRGGLDLV